MLGREANIKQKYRTVERHAADRDVTHKQRQTERRKAGSMQSDLDSGHADNGQTSRKYHCQAGGKLWVL